MKYIVGLLLIAFLGISSQAEAQSFRKQSNRAKAQNMSNYKGTKRKYTRRQRNQMLEGKSLNLADYQGKKRQYTKRQRNQMLEGKSLNMSTYQGTRRQRNNKLHG